MRQLVQSVSLEYMALQHMLEEALAGWFSAHEGKQAGFTWQRMEGKHTHGSVWLLLLGGIFSESLIPKLQDVNTWKEDFSERELSTCFYCLDNVSTGNKTEITVVEKEAIPTLFYHLGILQFIEVSYFSSDEKYEQQQKY